ncbi:pirin-like C-terminal cupin domain-containing protein [Streptomyces sp. NPDC059092]|uniref:pirin-like C-terminal cupin domain-containing protein n=1 Tax=Streptomyces sp. NPDC059092 TaxID=3346725 RepID=UPI00367DCD6F
MPAVTVESTPRLPRIPEPDPRTTEERAVCSVTAALQGLGETLTVEATTTAGTRTPDFGVLVLGGLPIREPIAHRGPFVMNTEAGVLQAIEDFNNGRLGFENAGRLPHTAPGEDAS